MALDLCNWVEYAHVSQQVEEHGLDPCQCEFDSLHEHASPVKFSRFERIVSGSVPQTLEGLPIGFTENKFLHKTPCHSAEECPSSRAVSSITTDFQNFINFRKFRNFCNFLFPIIIKVFGILRD